MPLKPEEYLERGRGRGKGQRGHPIPLFAIARGRNE